ncbi:MAG: RnfABCDGE type electron transport complex subunit B [Candidatus Margulisbacteria bacterium]|jgi:Na+-translocating ferredoxin:NAD+ oxidoreductase RNF subunit RnfB|nr:RnfABCDGE type electron transport complex subunit B [Candidatus Margulisiibacteriota bacterium]
MAASLMALIILGGVLGLLLATAAVWLSVAENPLIQQIQEILPGYNCGACGQSGCAGYAEALAADRAAIDLCAPGGAETLRKIAALLDKEAAAPDGKKTAFVFCQGGARALDAYAYSGISSCQSAAILQGGYKKCARACLGFGDCQKACMFGAITFSEYGVPRIDPDKCLDCGVCLKVCPKKIIQRVLQREMKRVVCSNHDTPKNAKSACAASCISCGRCVKKCPFQAIEIKDNLAVIDPEKCTNCGECVKECLTGAIV